MQSSGVAVNLDNFVGVVVCGTQLDGSLISGSRCLKGRRFTRSSCLMWEKSLHSRTVCVFVVVVAAMITLLVALSLLWLAAAASSSSPPQNSSRKNPFLLQRSRVLQLSVSPRSLTIRPGKKVSFKCRVKGVYSVTQWLDVGFYVSIVITLVSI